MSIDTTSSGRMVAVLGVLRRMEYMSKSLKAASEASLVARAETMEHTKHRTFIATCIGCRFDKMASTAPKVKIPS
jgi:multimeric flavodoxin WrbA